MKTFEQATIVLGLSDAIRRRGSWTGETHIQKAMYFLQHFLQLPTDFSFVLYKHGPFSFDLRATLTFMEAENLVRWHPRHYPYGPSLQPGPDHDYLQRHYSKFLNGYQRQIEFVADCLASRDVKDLERLATALYITLEGGPPAERPTKLNALKPHVHIEDATRAVQELDAVVAYATEAGFATALTTKLSVSRAF